MRVLLLAAILSASAATATAEDPMGPGPFEWRETWLLAQPRFTLSPTSAATLGKGGTLVAVRGDWGNDLGWNQSRAGESPSDRRFLVDGEHRSVAVEVRRGLGERLDVGLRVPLEWRGGGALDGVIDGFHGFTRRLGLPDNGRGSFEEGRLRFEGRDASGRPLAWDERAGTGLGRVELLTRWALRSPPAVGWRLALVGRVGLPAPSGPFAASGLAFGGQLVAGRPLGGKVRLHAGLGATVERAAARGDVGYRAARGHGFVAVERTLGRRFDLVAQSAAAGRLVTGVADYPWLQWYLSLGGRLRLDSGCLLEAAFTENVANQQATTDFGVQAAVSWRLGGR